MGNGNGTFSFLFPFFFFKLNGSLRALATFRFWQRVSFFFYIKTISEKFHWLGSRGSGMKGLGKREDTQKKGKHSLFQRVQKPETESS